MNLELMQALLELSKAQKLSDAELAAGLKYAMNGHANAVIPQAQLPLETSRKHTHFLTIDQMESIVQMYVANNSPQIIAHTLNMRYGLKLSKNAVASIIRDIRNGKKQTSARYQNNEWLTAFARWRQELGR